MIDYLDSQDGDGRTDICICCFNKFQINIVHVYISTHFHIYVHAFSVRVEWTALVKLDLFDIIMRDIIIGC